MDCLVSRMKIIEIRKMVKGNNWMNRLFLYSKLNEANLPIACKLVSQTVLQTSLENVLSLRLREGYTVKRVEIQKGL